MWCLVRGFCRMNGVRLIGLGREAAAGTLGVLESRHRRCREC